MTLNIEPMPWVQRVFPCSLTNSLLSSLPGCLLSTRRSAETSPHNALLERRVLQLETKQWTKAHTWIWIVNGSNQLPNQWRTESQLSKCKLVITQMRPGWNERVKLRVGLYRDEWGSNRTVLAFPWMNCIWSGHPLDELFWVTISVSHFPAALREWALSEEPGVNPSTTKAQKYLKEAREPEG